MDTKFLSFYRYLYRLPKYLLYRIQHVLKFFFLSSILFGLLHSYQGWKGGLRSGVIGLILALLYVLTGSLWIPIILHIVIDINSGMLGWLAFEENKQVESA